jgi:hypothetical protein
MRAARARAITITRLADAGLPLRTCVLRHGCFPSHHPGAATETHCDSPELHRTVAQESRQVGLQHSTLNLMVSNFRVLLRAASACAAEV